MQVKWHPTEAWLFTACLDGQLRLWDGLAGTLKRSWQGHQDQILDFALTPTGDRLVSGGDDQVCLVFDATAQAPVAADAASAAGKA